MAEFRMPSLGADMDSGTLIAWHMAVGDHIARGDIVAEVDRKEMLKPPVDFSLLDDRQYGKARILLLRSA